MTLLDRIRNWRLRHKIPANQRNKGRFRYAGNGKTKIFLDDQKEVEMYRHARKQQAEKERIARDRNG